MTGGRSRLGSVISAALSHGGANIISVSRTEGENHLGVEKLFVENLADRTDTLLHLAWSTVPMNSERHVGIEWEQDIPFLLRILKAVVASPNKDKLHFIFFSSGGAVYGNSIDGRPSKESDNCVPIGWYGHAKLSAEHLISEFGRRYGLVYTILRISNPYGFQVPLHRSQGLIPMIINHTRAGNPLSIWGDGSARKDFLYHSDFVAALREIISRRLVGVFNVSSGKSHTVNEVINFAEKALGKKIIVQYATANKWDVHDSLLDNSKIKSAIDWVPEVSLAEGISRTAEYLM